MHKARILIVEDEAIVAKELESQLQSLGYDVTSIVNTGEKAIEKAEADNPDLILMDIRIKGEMDGIETAEIIRNRFSIPVIFSTAYLDQERIERAKITMPFGYVLKPIQDRELRITLEMALYVTKVDQNRIQVEEALRESEDQYRSFVQNFQGIAYKGRLNFIPFFFHGKVKEITGYSEQEITSGNPSWNKVVHDEDLHLILEDNKKIRSMPFSTEREYRIVRKDGQMRWVKEYLQNVCDENNKPVFLNGVILDINEYRLAQEALRASEQRYRELFEKSKDAILFIEDRKFVDCNQATVDMLGYGSKEEFLRSHPSQLSPETQPDGRNSVTKADEMMENAILNGSHRFEWNHVKANGELFPVEVLLTAINNEKGMSVIHTVWRDITERKQAEEALWKNEQKYRTLANNIPGMIYRGNPDWSAEIISNSNPICGYSLEELNSIHMNWLDIIHPDDKESIIQEAEKLIEKSTSIIQIYRIISKDGDIRWVEDHKTSFFTGERHFSGVDGVVFNITTRKRAEEALKEYKENLEELVNARTKELEDEIEVRKQTEIEMLKAKEQAEEANKAKTEFLANISHELRNPMHQILSYSKYGIDKIDKPKEKLLHYFSQTRKSADRLMILVNDLLDLSKMESGKMEYSFDYNNVHQIVKEAISELKPEIQNKNLNLSLTHHSTISTSIICDYYKVGQVVRNLLSNAIKFTPEEKHIDIKFERKEMTNENSLIPALKISFCDQGVGIPENELSLVFEKFTQSTKTKTGAGGTGLGLSICQEIIKAHDGKIWAENNPDGGAIFSFLLPYEQKII